MKQTTQGTTVHYPFSAMSSDGLFSVSPGVPFEDALDDASGFLDVAKTLAKDAAMVEGGNNLMFAAAQMISMAKAVVDSVSFGCARYGERESHYEALLQRLHGLCDDGVLVLSSKAGKPAADDAKQFISWVAEQMCGESNRG